MTLRLTISRAILIFGLVTALGLGAVIATSVYGLSQLKVGGPLYNQIKLGNDLIADILPPPEYVIEAYLEATLVLHDPAQLSAHRDRIVQLKKEYDERRDFWVKSDLDPGLKTKLVEKSDSEVRRFWTAIQDGLLPALAKSDSAAAAKSYAEITARYTAHRAIIDDIVKQTNDQNAATEVAATGRVSTFTWVLWGVSAAVFLVIGAGIFGVAFGVIRPIAEMTAVMKGLAGGDLNVSVPALSRGDEVGAMARAVQVFRDNALRVQSMEQEQAGLKLKAEGERKAVMQQMADGFDSAIGKIIQTVSTASSELESSAGQLTKTAEVTQVLSATVASASEQSSANAQSAAAAAEEMASSVSEISRQVQDLHKISREAVSQVEQTNARISDLAQSASRIGEVVKMISAVAEQTNLLALNATIEAARAGEAGRGFAVVASEVKALAAQTAKATEDLGAEAAVGGRVVELEGVDDAALHGRHDLAARQLRHRETHGLHQIGGQAHGAVLQPLHVRHALDRPLEPAERLGRHGHDEEALDVDLHDLGLELFEQLAAAAVVDPAEPLVGVEAEHRAGAEQRGGLVLAVPVHGHRVGAVELAPVHPVEHLERVDDGPADQVVDLEPGSGHLVDALDVVLGELVEHVLGAPRALHLQGRRLGPRDLWERERRRPGHGGPGEELAPSRGSSTFVSGHECPPRLGEHGRISTASGRVEPRVGSWVAPLLDLHR